MEFMNSEVVDATNQLYDWWYDPLDEAALNRAEEKVNQWQKKKELFQFLHEIVEGSFFRSKVGREFLRDIEDVMFQLHVCRNAPYNLFEEEVATLIGG